MSEHDFWHVVLFLHLLGMAFFVGGQFVVAAAVVPVERHDANRERLRAIARRFGYGSLIALAVLLATGIAMASHWQLWSDGALQLKLGLVGLVFVLALLHLRWPRVHVIQAVILLLSLAIVWLGLAIGSGH